MAIPFIAIQGYHTLLDSRAGKFVAEPTRSDPGWRALVDPTSIYGVAEVDGGVVTGVALLINHPEVQSGGTVILVPGTLQIGGLSLAERAPEEAVLALTAEMRLSVSAVEVLDEAGWSRVLGSSVYQLDSPDPVLGDDGQPLFDVGPVSVTRANVAQFAGRPAPGVAPVSVQPRRWVLWNALLNTPPTTDNPLALELQAMNAELSQIVDLPVTQLEPEAIPDMEAIEALIRDVVAFPAGAVVGDRLQVRVLDRTGGAELEAIAAAVAADGMEVVEIGNANEFDGGVTEVIAPVTLVGADGSLPAELNELSRALGTSTVRVDVEPTDEFVVTVVIGSNFDLANLY